jgi:hypothetical protein
MASSTASMRLTKAKSFASFALKSTRGVTTLDVSPRALRVTGMWTVQIRLMKLAAVSWFLTFFYLFLDTKFFN